jgi:hypothetical protein
MNEEAVSVALFMAATSDNDVDVLSWQSVDGKNYFAFDIKLRLPTTARMEPDLVLQTDTLWLIEVKGKHSEAIEDEVKLVRLFDELGEDAIRVQIYRRAGIVEHDQTPIELAVAFGEEDEVTYQRCEPRVRHIDWTNAESLVAERGLAYYLNALRLGKTEGRDPG